MTYQPPDPVPPRHPYNLPAIQQWHTLTFTSPITFFIGENGSGKSTLLESLAAKAGFNPEGGSRNAAYDAAHTNAELGDRLRLVWNRKAANGFFLRAESFFQYVSYLEKLGPEAFNSYGGQSLHQRSHGESFLALFKHRLSINQPALYLLDEPEAALSITGQLALLRFMHQWEHSQQIQAVIATHSPILLAYPNAAIWTFDTSPLSTVSYRESSPYQMTRAFLEGPERYLQQLFSDD